jgi:hypothetical protein
MKDHAAHVISTFKTAAADASSKHGIDHKTEVGYWVGGWGAVQPIIVENEMQGLAPTWNFGYSLRSKLLGQPLVAGQLPIHSLMPQDDEIKIIAERLVTELSAQREAQFRGEL